MEVNDGCGDGGSLDPSAKRGMRDDTLLENDVLAVFENNDVLDTAVVIPYNIGHTRKAHIDHIVISTFAVSRRTQLFKCPQLTCLEANCTVSGIRA